MIEHENYSTWYFCCRSSIRKSVSTCALGVAKCLQIDKKVRGIV